MIIAYDRGYYIWHELKLDYAPIYEQILAEALFYGLP
jgi:hypothetical protein